MRFFIGIVALMSALILTEAYATEDINKFINVENGIQKTVTVTKIFDGDTIKVEDEIGVINTVRFLGIDTPEMANPPEKPNDEPYAQEAKQFALQLQDETVSLFISKVEGEQKDNFGRFLGVIVYNDEVFNVKLLENGLAARCFLYKNALLKYPAWEEREVAARKTKLKIWEYIGSKGVLINELNPNPKSVDDHDGEFIELYNASSSLVDISGWVLGCPYRTKPKITIPEGTSIPERGYLIFARADDMLFRQIYPTTPDSAVVIELSFGLANDFKFFEGCVVYLKDVEGAYQDAVAYNLKWDDEGANGTDKTLERVSYCVMNVGDSSIGGLDDENWNPSLNDLGTPGDYNSVSPKFGDVSLDGQISAYDATLILKYIVGTEQLQQMQLCVADVSGNEAISAFDAALILQKVVGLIDVFPAEKR